MRVTLWVKRERGGGERVWRGRLGWEPEATELVMATERQGCKGSGVLRGLTVALRDGGLRGVHCRLSCEVENPKLLPVLVLQG